MSRSQSTGQRGIKINILHESPVFTAVAEEIGEVLAGNLTLVLRLADLVLALSEVLDILRKAGLQVTSRDAEDAADFG